MVNDDRFDVLIVGGGPVGISCGIEASRRGLRYLIIEKGCLVNSIYHFPINMTFFSTSERLEIGDVPFIAHGYKPTRREALEYYRRVREKWQLQVHTYEQVLRLEGERGDFRVHTDRASYAARTVIIATGFYDNPNLLNVPGEELLKVKHYFDEPHPYAFHKLAVIGGGNSAVDAALETFRRSAEVTLIVREPALKDSIKYWVRPDIENRIREGAIKAYFNSTVTAIRKDSLDIQTPHGPLTISNDFVLAMTGYHPDFAFLESVGISLSDDHLQTPQYDPATFETNRAGVFLAGVVCGGMDTGRWFIENAHQHTLSIFNRLAEMGMGAGQSA